MRYIDNGNGNPRDEALFQWLQTVLTQDVVGIRWQSGFFEASVLGVFAPTLRRLAREDLDVIVLIGSNDGETQASSAHQLIDVLGLPRPNALLGVVSYADGFYHPKTVHLCYGSGREAAYVGSANLTSRGINGLNIEAGIVFDTEEGDPVEFLNCIKQAAREWFTSHPEGLFKVEDHNDVDQLEERGILTAERAPQRRQRVEDGGLGGVPLPRRNRRHVLPLILGRGREEDDDIEDEPINDGQVLIAKLAGPGRWGQAAFPEWFIHNFFEVLPDTGDVLRLWPITRNNGLGAEEEARCGFKAGSTNWYYELGLAVIYEYPQPPRRPIGVFHRVDYQACRYTILMPNDVSYRLVDRCLEGNLHLLDDLRDRNANELPRTIVPSQLLRAAWPNSWFFEV